MPIKLTTEILNAAIEGLEAQKSRIDAQMAEIRQMLNEARIKPAATPERANRKRKMSAAARKRIGDAQRKRWAETKRQPETTSQPVMPEAPKPKRKLSAAGRARIIAATKKRWAAVRAAERAGKAAGAKKAAGKKAVGGKKATKKASVKVGRPTEAPEAT